MPTQTEADIEKNRQLAEKIKEVISAKPSKKNVALVTSMMSEGYDAKDIAIALLEMQTEAVKPGGSGSTEKGIRATPAQSAAWYGSLSTWGKKDKIAARDIVGAIAGETKMQGSEIGKKLTYLTSFLLLKCPKHTHLPLKALCAGIMMKGRQMSFEPAAGRN